MRDGVGPREGAREAVAGEGGGAEIVRRECGGGGEVAGEGALVEGGGDHDGDATRWGDVGEFGGGFLLEKVVDERDAIDPAAAHAIDGGVWVRLGRGGADEADAALAREFAEDFGGRGVAVLRGRPGVEQEAVEAVGAEVGAALGGVFARQASG